LFDVLLTGEYFSMGYNSQKLRSVVLAGLVIGVISGLPFVSILNCLCGAGILMGGYLSVLFYSRSQPLATTPLSNLDAIQLGGMSGLLGSVFTVAFRLLAYRLVGNPEAEFVLKMFSGTQKEKLPEAILRQIESTSGNADMTPLWFLTTITIYPLLGMLGAAIGRAFRR
jgi:hypothetical protein